MTQILIVDPLESVTIIRHLISHLIGHCLARNSVGLALSIERVNFVEFFVVEAIEWEILRIAFNLNLIMLSHNSILLIPKEVVVS